MNVQVDAKQTVLKIVQPNVQMDVKMNVVVRVMDVAAALANVKDVKVVQELALQHVNHALTLVLDAVGTVRAIVMTNARPDVQVIVVMNAEVVV